MSAALDLAVQFHEIYERLAPDFGYETREETRQFDPESKNGRLMVAVCAFILDRLRAPVASEDVQQVIQSLRDGECDDCLCVADLLESLARQLAAAQGENVCDACAGTGKPISGGACMCGGTGKMSDATRYLREQLADEKAESARLLDRAKKYRDDCEQAQEQARQNVITERNLCIEIVRRYLLSDTQRAVSWHEVMDCIEVMRARAEQGGEHG